MRLQQVLTLSGLMAMGYASLGYAFPDVDENDIPKDCWRVCGKVVGMSHKCEGQFHDNDRGQQNCMCNWHGASRLIPLCEACVSKYESGNGDRRYSNDRDHDHDHDHDHDNDRDRDHDNDRDHDHDDGHDSDDEDDDRDHDRRVKRGNSPHDNDVYDIVTACNFSTTTYGPEATTAMTMATSTMTGASATGTGTGSGSGSSSSGTSGSGTSSDSSSSSTVDDSGSGGSSSPTNGAAAPAMPMTASVAAIGSLMALAWL